MVRGCAKRPPVAAESGCERFFISLARGAKAAHRAHESESDTQNKQFIECAGRGGVKAEPNKRFMCVYKGMSSEQVLSGT